jgi:hypothetical protein
MVTGQSLVLYSRLHLIMRGGKKLKWVLIMIIIDGLLCHIPVGVLVFASNSPNRAPFLPAYAIYEKVQVSIFFIQECIISGLYVWQTAKVLRPEGNIRGKAGRAVMTHLIYMNVLIIIMDITLLSVEYAGFYFIQTTYKAAVYSVKLKMEFSVLNRLIRLVHGNPEETTSDQQSHANACHFGIDNLTSNTRKNVDCGVTTTIALGPYNGNTSNNKASHHSAHEPEFTNMGGVLKTTNVTVEHSRMASDTEGDSERDSDRIAEDTDNSLPEERHKRCQSAASSSEVQFAKNGF